MIEQGALFKLGILNVGMDREQPPRHLQHVIDVAAFVGAPFDAITELVWWPKILIATVSAGRITVMQSHRVPEKFRRRAVRLVAGVDVAREIANHLWHLCVSMQTRKDVLVSRRWIAHGLMIDMMREI